MPGLGIQNEKQANNQVVNQARILSRQIILTRQWISDSGGVFENLQSQGDKDIACYIDDRLQTTTGLYQRFTPSMVTRKLSQYSKRQEFYRFHLASLNLLNPENKPDRFEKEALSLFRRIKPGPVGQVRDKWLCRGGLCLKTQIPSTQFQVNLKLQYSMAKNI